MDPVCHTLVGAALGRAGLARRSSLGMTALIIGANLPDIDVLAHFGGPAADLAFRRGWTHGVLALAVLPAVLTGVLLAAHGAVRRASRASLPSATRPAQLLLLSYLAVLTHPILDTMNTYGVRWLMPFSERWFYGDTLFIIDPWMYLALGLGLYFSRRRRTRYGFRESPSQPPKLALIAVMIYMIAMALSSGAAERMVASEVAKTPGPAVDDVMASPRPATPFARSIVVVRGNRYITGQFRWLTRPHLVPASLQEFPRGVPTDRDVHDALQVQVAQRFLGWSRYPTFRVRTAATGGRVVDVIDLRYASTAARFGTLTLPLPLSVTAPALPPAGDSLPPPSTTGRTAPAP